MTNANNLGNSEKRWNYGENQFRNTKDNLPGMQRLAEEQKGPMSLGDVQAGRRRLALLALRICRRSIS